MTAFTEIQPTNTVKTLRDGRMTEYYLAPMEGITGYIYRNAIRDYFSEGVKKYYTPFLVVHEKRAMSSKEINEILPENNRGINLVPQILADDADGFLRIEKSLKEYGYSEVNLNLGCPSKTVAGKGRGSGFLERINELDEFLYEIFKSRVMNISVKTRIGSKSTEEFENLLGIFNKYPIHELTIHPRIRYEYYTGTPHREIFYEGFRGSVNPVCYNGDVLSGKDVDELMYGTKGELKAIMIGRGMLRDPSLIRKLSGGESYSKGELKDFLKRIRMDYTQVFSGETQVLKKMKELWGYMGADFAGKDSVVRDLLKCRSLSEYKILEQMLLSE